MTPEAQRIAIAEACGLTEIHREIPGGRTVEFWMGMRGDSFRSVCVPDYLNDLNAMQEAEEQAGLVIIKAMRFHLWEICGQMTAHHATAAQRAEAFLKAIGKWVD